MNKEISWNEAYHLWQIGATCFPTSLSDPIAVENIFIDYSVNGGYIDGVDWLENSEAEQQKIEMKNDFHLLYSERSSSKGIIQTAKMLMESTDDEERAAIWIAATSLQMMSKNYNGNIAEYAGYLYGSVYEWLKKRFLIWNPAMKKTIPYIIVPYQVLENFYCENHFSLIGLIQMNTLMIQENYKIVKYSSANTPEISHSVRR